MNPIEHTETQYKDVIDRCKSVFIAKSRDYGTSWRVLRLTSITDQMFIKARRIRSIEEKGQQQVVDSVTSEWIALVNYGIMSIWIWQSEHNIRTLPEDNTSIQILYAQYQEVSDEVFELMLRKNHDYGEAWREMRTTSMTDLVLMKLLRIKQLEDNKNGEIQSEGVEANYADIVNYAVFALILIHDKQNGPQT